MTVFLTILVLAIVAFLILGSTQGPRIRAQAAARYDTLMLPIAASHKWDYLYLANNREDRLRPPTFVLGISFHDHVVAIGRPSEIKYYDFSKIIRVDMLQNETQAISSSGGAVGIGGVGLASAKLKTLRFVSALSLKVIVDDPVDPIKVVPFFQSFGKGLPVRDRRLKEPIAEIEHAEALLANVIAKKN